MSIKILGGIARSQSLFVPRGLVTRPTSVQLRRKIFDSRQELEGFKFVDLCAGSGAMGFEAWSRGAEEVILVEKNFQSIQTIRKNIQTFKDRFSSELEKRPIHSFKKDFKKFETLGLQSSIIFLDPPYEAHHLYRYFKELIPKLLEQGNELWIESDSKKGVSLSFWDSAHVVKAYTHSDSYLVVCKA